MNLRKQVTAILCALRGHPALRLNASTGAIPTSETSGNVKIGVTLRCDCGFVRCFDVSAICSEAFGKFSHDTPSNWYEKHWPRKKNERTGDRISKVD